MKFIPILAVGVHLFVAHLAHADISPELNSKIEQVFERLHKAKEVDDYKIDEYIKDLKDIAGKAKDYGSEAPSGDGSPQKRAIIALALEIQKPEVMLRIDELKDWYGGYAYELPEDLFRKYVALTYEVAKRMGRDVTYEDLRHRMRYVSPKGHIARKHPGPPIVEFRDEHMKPEYLSAWKFWLIAPPSKEQKFMTGRLNVVLEKIGDESIIPLVTEALKTESGRDTDERIRTQRVMAYINLICKMPGEKALDALLEINRYVIENNLNDADYFRSITRHIIRRLASRRAYADQLIDPKMKETIERQGYNEKPEDIPLVDGLWKQYKPLIEARLKAKTDKTPKADIDLLESAQKIMPKR